MKKVTLFLALFVLNSTMVAAASFPDVQEGHKNYQAIESLSEKGIIDGYPDGEFKPDSIVNRAEAAKMILNAFKIAHDESYDEDFPDVDKEAWYFPFVMAGKKAGLINGYPDGKFKPGDTVNLAESLKITSLAAKVDVSAELKDVFFTDVALDVWYAPYFFYARNHNVVLADDYGAVNPGQPMTRAAFAEVVYRMMIVSEKNGAAFPLESEWKLYQGKDIPFEMKYDPTYWSVIEKGNETVFLKPDKEFAQFSDARIYANTGVVKIVLDKNENDMSRAEYFDNIQKSFASASYKEFNFGKFKALEVLYSKEKTVDWYIYMDNGDVMAVYTQYGNGILGYQLQQAIKGMLSTLAYQPVAGDGEEVENGDNAEVLGKIFAKVLVEGAGEEILNLLSDEVIIETDAIGVGTGPVDYYYSEVLHYTIKYERSSKTILDTNEGRTTAF